MNTNYNKREIFLQAYDLCDRFGFSFSECLKKAWALAKFKKQASAGIVHFYFMKRDGSIREAFGTISSNIVPATNGESRHYADTQVYFDTEKQEWRCFKTFNILKVA